MSQNVKIFKLQYTLFTICFKYKTHRPVPKSEPEQNTKVELCIREPELHKMGSKKDRFVSEDVQRIVLCLRMFKGSVCV